MLLGGCARVPATRISYDPVHHAIDIRSPKDIAITNFVATIETNGTCTLRIGSYWSHNNLDVVQAIAAANAAAAKALADVAVQAVGTAVQAAK